MGSGVSNIKLDPQKQKIVNCDACDQPLVVGKFAKMKQTCETANYFPSSCPKLGDKKPSKPKSAKKKIEESKNSIKIKTPVIPDKKTNGKNGHVASNLTQLMNKLEFDIDDKLRYKKKYAIDGGGIATIYPFFGEKMGDHSPKIEYFNVIIQRVVGVNEDFRRFMPPDAASDCELISAELGEHLIFKPEIGMTECDKCGAKTDEYGVDPKKGRVLCIKPNKCFANYHNQVAV